MRSSRASNLTVALLLLTAAAAGAAERQPAVVAEIVTGDTVRLKGGKLFRYAGIKAPPAQSKIPLVREYGEAAIEANRRLVEGRQILIQWDRQIRDENNNLVGYAYLEDGTFVNDTLLKEGHARAIYKAPNTTYSSLFRHSELSARRQRKGLWREEPENPYLQHEYIGEINTKIYYFPTSPELERIPAAHLRPFKSRVEAKAAGYRPCFTCKEGEIDEG
ncbi:MAG: hypothetical protein MOGMAGMI_00940 [Candidatus Omnitrophica bacterium]|nr:hypothetical protein [Candidatus Omnitrophota bacterium]